MRLWIAFESKKKYYIDSPIIKHHSKVYKNKLVTFLDVKKVCIASGGWAWYNFRQKNCKG